MSLVQTLMKKVVGIKRAFFDFLNYYILPVKVSLDQMEIDLPQTIDGRYVVASKSGLFLLKRDNLYRIREGDFYGVTIQDNSLLVFERIGNRGRIISLEQDVSGRVKERGKVILRGLSHGCHQIDMIDDQLYITDTYNNRILEVELVNKSIRSFYPLGTLSNGRKSTNYGHINSIIRHNAQYYIYCHNETTKTERKSQIIITKNLETPEKILDLEDENGHNVVVFRECIYHCDSMNSKLRVNNEVVFECEKFTRGLSISEDSILLGGSDYANREDRSKSAGSIYILSIDHKLIDQFWFPGMVQEIRRLDKPDYSLTKYADMKHGGEMTEETQ